MRVQHFATCIGDLVLPEAVADAEALLREAGHDVVFPPGQVCCGQPAFNGGDWDASRKVVRHTVRTFAGTEPVIVPSGSCAAMLFHGAVLEFELAALRAEYDARRPQAEAS